MRGGRELGEGPRCRPGAGPVLLGHRRGPIPSPGRRYLRPLFPRDGSQVPGAGCRHAGNRPGDPDGGSEGDAHHRPDRGRPTEGVCGGGRGPGPPPAAGADFGGCSRDPAGRPRRLDLEPSPLPGGVRLDSGRGGRAFRTRTGESDPVLHARRGVGEDGTAGDCRSTAWRRTLLNMEREIGMSPSGCDQARLRSWLGVVPLLLVLLLAGGCSRIPKIIILEDPLTAAEHVELGVAYERKGELDLARREYERALRKDGKFYRARLNLGNIFLTKKEYGKAREEYLLALELRPGDAEATNNLSWAAIFSGEGIDEALARMESVVSIPTGRQANLLDTLGVLRMRANRCLLYT